MKVGSGKYEVQIGGCMCFWAAVETQCFASPKYFGTQLKIGRAKTEKLF